MVAGFAGAFCCGAEASSAPSIACRRKTNKKVCHNAPLTIFTAPMAAQLSNLPTVVHPVTHRRGTHAFDFRICVSDLWHHRLIAKILLLLLRDCNQHQREVKTNCAFTLLILLLRILLRPLQGSAGNQLIRTTDVARLPRLDSITINAAQYRSPASVFSANLRYKIPIPIVVRSSNPTREPPESDVYRGAQ